MMLTLFTSIESGLLNVHFSLPFDAVKLDLSGLLVMLSWGLRDLNAVKSFHSPVFMWEDGPLKILLKIKNAIKLQKVKKFYIA